MARFRTAGGSVSAAGRKEAQGKGETMPGTDKFPIRNASDLEHAKEDIGRTNQPAAARRWINRRAGELGEPKLGESNEGGGKKRSLYTHSRKG